jgi:hypothetical protein
VFRKVEIIFDLKKALKPFINKAIIYAQVPHKIVFKRHPHTGRCHMTYAVFSDEPMQPPEPKFNHDHVYKSIDAIVMKPLCLVGGRKKFLDHLGVPQDVESLTKLQSDTLCTMSLLESGGVFDELQQKVIEMKISRCFRLVSLALDRLMFLFF